MVGPFTMPDNIQQIREALICKWKDGKVAAYSVGGDDEPA